MKIKAFDMLDKGIKNIAINVKDLDEFQALMELLRKDGFKWIDDTKPSEYDIDEWYKYEEETCIYLYEENKEITYSNIWMALEDGYIIMSFDTFKNR